LWKKRDGDERNTIRDDSYVTTVVLEMRNGLLSCPTGRSIFPNTVEGTRPRILPHVYKYSTPFLNAVSPV
jgi:hypothetical protein